MIRALALTAVIVAVLAAGGCGDDAQDTATFVAVDTDYEDAPAELPAGEVTVELVNDGDLEHTVVFEDLGDELVAAAAGGETATGTVDLTPGEHVVYCNVPGHREAGMETTITVRE